MKKAQLFIFLISTILSCKSPVKEPVVEANETIQILDKTDFKTGIAKQDIQLLDVRTPKEYEEGHIGDAILIDFLADDFKDKVQSLDKNKPVYLYCRSGGRSGKASKLLEELGFIEIYDLKGGYMAWDK